MAKLIAYDFRDRRKVTCYKCGEQFPEGRYREHVMRSKHSKHVDERKYKQKR